MLAFGRRLVIPGAAIVFWIIVFLHISPVVPGIVQLLSHGWEQPEGDVFIVLAADQLSDGTIGIGSYWRTVYAVKAWRKGSRIVFSGGAVTGNRTTQSGAAAMASFARSLGVPDMAITVEEHSLSTHENAMNTTAMVRSWPGKKVLITSDFHTFRALGAFRRAGLDLKPAPAPDVGKRWNSWQNRWECIGTVTTELTKLGYYRLKGWI